MVWWYKGWSRGWKLLGMNGILWGDWCIKDIEKGHVKTFPFQNSTFYEQRWNSKIIRIIKNTISKLWKIFFKNDQNLIHKHSQLNITSKNILHHQNIPNHPKFPPLCFLVLYNFLVSHNRTIYSNIVRFIFIKVQRREKIQKSRWIFILNQSIIFVQAISLPSHKHSTTHYINLTHSLPNFLSYHFKYHLTFVPFFILFFTSTQFACINISFSSTL